MRGEEVKKILKKNKIKQAEIARKMDITPQNLYSMLKSEDISTGIIEKIQKHAKINIFCLFYCDNEKQYSQSIRINEINDKDPPVYECRNCKNLNKEIELLKQQIKDKETIIELLKVKAQHGNNPKKAQNG